jgi:hypothetical protein
VGVPDGRAGFLSDDFTESVRELMRCRTLREQMGCEARRFACSRAWGGVFEGLYNTYGVALDTEEVRCRLARKRAVPPRTGHAATA